MAGSIAARGVTFDDTDLVVRVGRGKQLRRAARFAESGPNRGGCECPGCLIAYHGYGTLRCLIGALAILVASLVAVGETPQTDGLALELTWEVPQGCPDLASERAEIRRRVGDVARASPPEPIVVQGEIRVDASGGYSLSLRTRVGAITGERVLSGQDCHELADAAALMLALLINPEAALPAEPAPAAPPAVPPPRSLPPAPMRQRSGFGCGLDAVLASAVLPGQGQGLAARFFYQRGLLAAAGQVAGFLPSEKRAPLLPGASASFQRFESALALCAATPSAWRLGGMLCLGGAVVRLHGESSSVSKPGQATAYWPEGLLAALGHLRLSSATRLHLAVELHGLGSRPDFAIIGLGSTYRPAPVNLRGALGIDVLF